jgi:hypothetical protein
VTQVVEIQVLGLHLSPRANANATRVQNSAHQCFVGGYRSMAFEYELGGRQKREKEKGKEALLIECSPGFALSRLKHSIESICGYRRTLT